MKKVSIQKNVCLAIMAASMLLLAEPSPAVAEGSLMLASLTRITPLEDLESVDRFPGYHKEARKVEKKIKVETDIIDALRKADKDNTVDPVVSSAEWVGNKAVDGYIILNGDYPQLLMGVLSD